jgi:hypothetical protein
VSCIIYHEMKSDTSSNSIELINPSVQNCITACLIISSFANALFSIFNLIIVISSIFRYNIYLKLRKVTVDYSKVQNLWNTELWWELLIEIIFAIPHPNLLFESKKKNI